MGIKEVQDYSEEMQQFRENTLDFLKKCKIKNKDKIKKNKNDDAEITDVDNLKNNKNDDEEITDVDNLKIILAGEKVVDEVQFHLETYDAEKLFHLFQAQSYSVSRRMCKNLINDISHTYEDLVTFTEVAAYFYEYLRTDVSQDDDDLFQDDGMT